MATISQALFSDAFLWMKSFVFWLKFHWSLFLRIQLIITQHWFRQWLSDKKATSRYLNQCWPKSLMQICGNIGVWINVFFHLRKAIYDNPQTMLIHDRRRCLQISLQCLTDNKHLSAINYIFQVNQILNKKNQNLYYGTQSRFCLLLLDYQVII